MLKTSKLQFIKIVINFGLSTINSYHLARLHQQSVDTAQRTADAAVKKAEADASSLRLQVDAEGTATKMRANAETTKINESNGWRQLYQKQNHRGNRPWPDQSNA